MSLLLSLGIRPSASTEGQAWMGKAAIMGALSLYLDFLNMFMFLLSFMGNRE